MNFDDIKTGMPDTLFFKCDHCKNKFLAKTVETIDAPLNLIPFPKILPVMKVKEDGDFVSSEEKFFRKGDKILVCPICRAVHLGGFSEYEEVKCIA